MIQLVVSMEILCNLCNTTVRLPQKLKTVHPCSLPELKTWTKCRYFDPLNYNRVLRESLQCIYVTENLTFRHCHYNSMPSEMILGTFHLAPFYIYLHHILHSLSRSSQVKVTSLLTLCSDFFNNLQELCSTHASVLILSILDSRGKTSYLRTSIKWFQYTLTRNKQRCSHFLTIRRGSGLTGVIYFLYVPWRILVGLLSIPEEDLCYAIFSTVRHSVNSLRHRPWRRLYSI